MLSNFKDYTTAIAMIVFPLFCHSESLDHIKFRDESGSKYSINTFADVWNKKLNIKDGEYFFVVTKTKDGRDKNYVKQIKLLKSMKNAFEENHIVWINGCTNSCPVLGGYEIIQENRFEYDAFRIVVLDSKGTELISSTIPLAKQKIIDNINKEKTHKTSD